MLKLLSIIFHYELKSSFIRKSNIFGSIIFFTISASLFPFIIQHEFEILKQIGFGILIISYLYTALLDINNVILNDIKNGSLEQLIILLVPIWLIVFVKTIIHWLKVAVPCFIIIPIIANLFYQVNYYYLFNAMIVFFFSSFLLSNLVIFSTMLTAKLEQSTLLNAIIICPLTISLMIFTINTGYCNEHFLLTSDAKNAVFLMLSLILIILPLNCFAGNLLIKEAIR